MADIAKVEIAETPLGDRYVVTVAGAVVSEIMTDRRSAEVVADIINGAHRADK